MAKVLIAPSILSADFANLADEIKKIEKGGADLIHVDVMDGRFVPNITIGAPVVKSLKKVSKLPLDVHLMIVEPEKHIKDFIDAGADIVTVHAEACHHLDRTLHMIQDLGAKAGVSLNPHTPVETIKHLMTIVDLILIMSVNPGFGGQKFIPYSLDKIKAIKDMAYKSGRDIEPDDLLLEVDGGVIPGAIARDLKAAGANVLVAGSAVYGADDVKKAIKALRDS